MGTTKWLLRENIVALTQSFGCLFPGILKKRENFCLCRTLHLPLLPSIQMAQMLTNSLKYLFDGFEGFSLFVIFYPVPLVWTWTNKRNGITMRGVTKMTTRKQKKQQERATACKTILHWGQSSRYFWASFFVYIEFFCTFVTTFFLDITLLTENPCKCLWQALWNFSFAFSYIRL